MQTAKELVPTEVQQSLEFRSACPAGAIVTRKARNDSEESSMRGMAPHVDEVAATDIALDLSGVNDVDAEGSACSQVSWIALER